MKLGNLACGAVRPQGEEWWNVDTLRSVLAPGTPERQQLDSEPRYIEANLETEGVPFDDGSMDSLLLSHALEHFDCQAGVRIMADCHRALKPGGVLLVSVPDASYFRAMHVYDRVENAKKLFGEEIHLPDGETTFTGYALWNKFHRAILCEDSLWHYFKRAGFARCRTVYCERVGEEVRFMGYSEFAENLPMKEMIKHLNRLPFSLVMAAQKE